MKKRKSNTLGIVSIISYLTVGFILGFAVGDEILISENPAYAILLLIGTILISIYAQVIVHESGHLIFGLLTGYKFSSFRIGVFTLMKNENGKLRLKLMRVPGTSGQCLLAPPEPVNGIIPQVLYNVGGVIMNLTVSSVILAFVMAFDLTGASKILLLGISLVGFALALINGIPMRSNLICNDGMNALSAKAPNANRALYNTLKLAWYQAKGYRMKDMPSELFSFPDIEGFKSPLIASEAVFVIDRIMDMGYLGDASDLIDIALRDGEALNGVYVSLLKSNRLFVSLMAGRDREYIESLLDKDMKRLMKTLPNAMFGVYTAYAFEKLYKGDIIKADKIRKAFTKRAKAYPYRGETESAQALMDRVDAQWDFWNRV